MKVLALLGGAVLGVLLLGGAPAYADCPTPDGVPASPVPTSPVLDPDTGAECVRVVPEPAATTSSTPTATASPAPGEDSGVYVDPTTGSVKVDQGTFVGLGVVVWLASCACGLVSAWVVLP